MDNSDQTKQTNLSEVKSSHNWLPECGGAYLKEWKNLISQNFATVECYVLNKVTQYNCQTGFETYLPFGDASAATFLNEKAVRAMTYYSEDDLEEHLTDLIGFAILWLSWRQNSQKKKNTS